MMAFQVYSYCEFLFALFLRAVCIMLTIDSIYRQGETETFNPYTLIFGIVADDDLWGKSKNTDCAVLVGTKK